MFTILGNTSAFTHVRYKAGAIAVNGELKTLLYELPYELVGNVDEESIRFEMRASIGIFHASGTSIRGGSKASLP